MSGYRKTEISKQDNKRKGKEAAVVLPISLALSVYLAVALRCKVKQHLTLRKIRTRSGNSAK
jgi:hypothetical protein